MAGETEELTGFFERQRRLQDELRRTSDLGQRRTIQARLEAAGHELAEIVQRIKTAADSGELEARLLLDAFREAAEELD